MKMRGCRVLLFERNIGSIVDIYKKRSRSPPKRFDQMRDPPRIRMPSLVPTCTACDPRRLFGRQYLVVGRKVIIDYQNRSNRIDKCLLDKRLVVVTHR